MIKFSVPVYNWLNNKLPQNFKYSIKRYSSEDHTPTGISDWKIILKSYLLQLTLHTMIIVGIIFSAIQMNMLLSNYSTDSFSSILIFISALLLISPFWWALCMRKIQPEILIRVQQAKQYKGPLIVLQLVRYVVSIALIVLLMISIISLYLAILLGVLIIVFVVLNYQKLQLIYEKIEDRFISNLHAKEHRELKKKASALASWDAHITKFTVPESFTGIGKTLIALRLRETFGVNIAMIKRGGSTIQSPSRKDQLYPNDILYIIGVDEQIELFKKYLEAHSGTTIERLDANYKISMQQVTVTQESVLAEKTIYDSKICQRTQSLIVGIERNGERILNPESSTLLKVGDLLWIAGNRKKIKAFLNVK